MGGVSSFFGAEIPTKERFLEGSLKKVVLRRVLTKRIRGLAQRRGFLEGSIFMKGAQKAETCPFAEYEPLRVQPCLVVSVFAVGEMIGSCVV